MATITAYNFAGTSLGTVRPSMVTWDHRQADDGFGHATVRGNIAAAFLSETVVLRVNDGTADRFAFLPLSKIRRSHDSSHASHASELALEGPGVRYLLHAGQVYQEDTSDCALPADVRWFGWMAAAYDDSAWTAPVSHGRWADQPFEGAVRAEGWPVRWAQMLWRTTSYDLQEEEVLFRQDFTLDSDQDVVLCITADDEYECWLDGTKLRIGTYGGDRLYNWADFDQYPIRLCAGDHVFSVRGRNFDANVEGQNPGWVMWAFAEAASDGQPAAANDVHTITTNATGGTWTIRIGTSSVTSTVDWNVSTADLQTALETQVGAGNVDVSGEPGAWVIEMVGARASTFHVMQVDGTGLTGGTISKEHTVQGQSAKTVAYSTTDTVVMHHVTGAEPGMTPGAILLAALDEARARGTTVLDDMADGFTGTIDSNGDAWTFELSMQVPLPADVHRVAVLLEEQGVDVWVDPDLTVQCAQEQGDDTTIAAVLTPGPGGTGGVTDVEARREESTVRNVVRVRSEKGWHEASDSSSVTARGRWEAGIILEGFETGAAAAPHVSMLLSDLATPQRHTSLKVPSEGALLPYVDFGLGDRVTGPAFGTSGWDQVAMRVVAISGQVEEASVVWTVELVD